MTSFDTGDLVTIFAAVIAFFSFRQAANQIKRSQAKLVYHRVVGTDIFETNEALPNSVSFPNSVCQPEFYSLKSDLYGNTIPYANIPLVHVIVEVYNRSEELISPAKIQLIATADNEPIPDFSYLADYLEPGSRTEVHFYWPNPVPGKWPSVSPTTIYRDSNNNWWRRNSLNPVRAVHHDPENGMRVVAERKKWFEGVTSDGTPYKVEYKASTFLRIRRCIRKITGKTEFP